jgi:hypothetical protein
MTTTTIPLTVSFFTEETLKNSRLKAATKQRPFFNVARAAIKLDIVLVVVEEDPSALIIR